MAVGHWRTPLLRKPPDRRHLSTLANDNNTEGREIYSSTGLPLKLGNVILRTYGAGRDSMAPFAPAPPPAGRLSKSRSRIRGAAMENLWRTPAAMVRDERAKHPRRRNVLL